MRLSGPDRATAALWVDQSYPIIELYTADTLAPQRRRTGLGIEPTTCPLNAFQSGKQVIRLEPGQTHDPLGGAADGPRGPLSSAQQAGAAARAAAGRWR